MAATCAFFFGTAEYASAFKALDWSVNISAHYVASLFHAGCGHAQLKSVLFAPLMIEQRAVGVIGLANKTGGFTKRDAEMAMAFGEIASVALANSKMHEMLEENEKELKMHSEHLEKLVEERTKQLKDSERLATMAPLPGWLAMISVIHCRL